MNTGNTSRSSAAALLAGAASKFADATESMTASAITEMTAAEIALVAGGIEQNHVSGR